MHTKIDSSEEAVPSLPPAEKRNRRRMRSSDNDLFPSSSHQVYHTIKLMDCTVVTHFPQSDGLYRCVLWSMVDAQRLLTMGFS